MIAHFLSILPKIGLTEADVPARAGSSGSPPRPRGPARRSRSPSAGAARRRATLRPFLAPRRADPALAPTATERDDRPLRALPRRAPRAASGLTRWASLEWILTAFVLAGALPLLAGCYQFVLAGLHRFRHREHGTLEREPNVAVVVPAWNEAAVIGRTIDTLLGARLPGRAAARLRRRRRQHRRDARRRARQGRASTRAASSTCAAPRAARARRTRSTTGCARSAPRAGTRPC